MARYYDVPDEVEEFDGYRGDRDRGDRDRGRDSLSDTLDAFAHRARTSPIPLIMAGIGIAGLLLNRRPARSSSYDDHDYRMPVGPYPAKRSGDRLDALKSKASDLTDGLGDTVSSVQSKAGDLAGDLAEDLSETVSDLANDAYRTSVAGYKVARNHAAHLARTAPDHGARVASQTGTWARENPVTIGLAALAVGTIAASFLTYKRRGEHDDYPRPAEPAVDVERIQPAPATVAAASGKPSSPDVSSAIPAGKSKVGNNVVESTSVLGVAEGEKKT